MNRPTTIALDAMGGDNAPDMVIGGAKLALERHPDLRFLFFGDVAHLSPLVKADRKLADASEIRHTDKTVLSTDRPSQALRQGRDSSMRLAINSVADGEAQGVVSAGNTGALMAMSKFVLKMTSGIERPAICSTLPTMQSETVMLDLGANVDCDAENLVQFAIMGAAFARAVVGRADPSVGLLNVGEEELKGNEAVRTAAGILKAASLPLRFHGFVEGDDILKGTTDVVVTDGFSGNVALKAVEGTAKLYSSFLRTTLTSNLFARLGYLLARPSLQALRDRVDPRRYNGGVFLGLNGVSVKSHGSTDELGFAHAIDLAFYMIREGLIDRITADMAQFSHDAESLREAVGT